MDEDRWENIILGEITVLSRLNHPHAAPPPFVASFPITKLVPGVRPRSSSPGVGREGTHARPSPTPCHSLLSPSGSGSHEELQKAPNPAGFHQGASSVSWAAGESTALLPHGVLPSRRTPSPSPFAHLCKGSLVPLSRFTGKGKHTAWGTTTRGSTHLPKDG